MLTASSAKGRSALSVNDLAITDINDGGRDRTFVRDNDNRDRNGSNTDIAGRRSSGSSVLSPPRVITDSLLLDELAQKEREWSK